MMHVPTSASLPLAYHWDSTRPPPRVALRLANRRPIRVPEPPAWLATGPDGQPFDFTAAMHELCADTVARTPALAHIDLSRVLFSINLARNGRRHGLQARVTPLRFQGGALASVHRKTAYQVQRVVVDGREILYLVTFCLPRFLNREFEDKLVTVFHELYHIGPAFDGDLRRHAGRYCAHTGSQKKYDAHMAALAKKYLNGGADPARYAFLRLSFGQLCRRHGSVIGLHLPRPKLIPIPFTPPHRPGSPAGPPMPDTPR
jgi:predicted metallopeptidase